MYAVDMHAWWSRARSLFTRCVFLSYNRVLRSTDKETRTVKLAKNYADQLWACAKGRSHDCCVQLAD